MATDYRAGGRGMTQWIEDHVCFPIYEPGSDLPRWVAANALPDMKNPSTGRSPRDMWLHQKDILHQALEMDEKGRFIYSLIVFCWMRGETKSFMVCLIQLWKFFNWPRQQIMLGANSKDQVKFVHYDMIRDIILNSPKLLGMIGKKNIREKEIRLRDKDENIVSFIRTISTASGIVSNITGYTFSEVFDMKKPKFFNQLDGSMRNVPNSLGVIDSTVSTKTHFLYEKLYLGWKDGKIKRIFFSYRCSPDADYRDYWHPYMDKATLDDFSGKMMQSDFDRYFKNIWSTGSDRLISDIMIREMGYMGVKLGGLLNHDAVVAVLNEYDRQHDIAAKLDEDNKYELADAKRRGGEEMVKTLVPVDDLYGLSDPESVTRQLVDFNDLLKVSDLLDTDFALLAGSDMGDPLQVRGQARSMQTFIMKCLPGSRSRAFLLEETEGRSPLYVYFLVGVINYLTHSLDELKNDLEYVHTMYDGVNAFTSERYGSWNMVDWCAERSIKLELVYPEYRKQKEAFKELTQSLRFGRFKAPRVHIMGSQMEDVVREELGVFDHESESEVKGRFFSPSKFHKDGIQDDFIYACAWALYGGRTVTVADFFPRAAAGAFGQFVAAEGAVGNY